MGGNGRGAWAWAWAGRLAVEAEDTCGAQAAAALALAAARGLILPVLIPCEQWALRELLAVGLRLQQIFELEVLNRARAVLIHCVEEVVHLVARGLDTEHRHRPPELLPRDAAVAVLIPLAKEADAARGAWTCEERQLAVLTSTRFETRQYI